MSKLRTPIVLILIMLAASACSLASFDRDFDQGPRDGVSGNGDNVIIIDNGSQATEEPTAIPTNTPVPTAEPVDDSTTGTNGGTSGNTSGWVTCYVRTDWLVYHVVAGDTVSSIARRTNSTVNEIATGNCLADASSITVGQQLRVPRTPVSNNQQVGYVLPSDYVSLNGTLYTLPSNQTITLTWHGASFTGLSQVNFLYYPSGSSSGTLIGSDTYLYDGASVTWYVPNNVYGKVVARGNVNTGGVRYSADLDVLSGQNPVPDTFIGRVEISPAYTNNGVDYTFDEGTTITLRWPQLSTGGVTRVEFYMAIASAGSPAPTIIVTDSYIADGVAASVSLLPRMSGPVTAVAYRSDGSRVHTAQPVTVYTVPNYEEPPVQGNIIASPILAADGNTVTLEEGVTVTLSWDAVPEHVGQAEFIYSVGDLQNPVTIGIDTNMGDGASVTWVVPQNLSGHIEIIGMLPGQNHQTVRSHWLYFDTLPSDSDAAAES